MRNLLEACRQRLGAAPRLPDLLHVAPPKWLREARQDDLWRIFQEQRPLVSEGRVVWGVVVQANGLLFSPGDLDHPAAMLYSHDPAFDDDPEPLIEAALQAFALREETPADPALAEIARLLNDEKARPYNVRLPHPLAGDRDLRLTTTLIVRRHLPAHHLANTLVPLLAHPPLAATLVLPADYWPEDLRYAWED